MLNGSNGTSQGGVALLVDFENLVLSAGGGREADCAALLALAGGYGPVRVANVYADWRTRTMRDYPDGIHGLGVEFVQVLGRRRGRVLKNAVDVRMAVDAVELVRDVPGIGVYVIVSGDRDFVEVVQALKRHGKTVVGVARRGAVGAELVGVCDRFVYYESMEARVGARAVPAPAGPLRALVRGGRAAKCAARRMLRVREGSDGGAPTGAGVRADAPTVAVGGRRAIGWGWFEWAREQLASGAVAANEDGGWLHRIDDEAFAVVPDCFEEWAAREGVAVTTAKNRVHRLRLHRRQRRGGVMGDRFHAALGDGRKARGMLFPGGLLWGDEEPEIGRGRLV
ncbi:MAG: NYN domain-containing protein [Gammaproteobacteria bacterium]|nr:NYN domain-containing protein [Gammaproteobacteria bacterium]